MLRFAGVTAANFPSILRRSLVWKARARFLPAAFLSEHYPDSAEDGIFGKNPELKRFVTTGPAVLAAIRIQHGRLIDPSILSRLSIPKQVWCIIWFGSCEPIGPYVFTKTRRIAFARASS